MQQTASHLGARLVARLRARGGREDAVDAETVADRLATWLGEAQSRWPEVALQPLAFVDHVADRLPADQPLEQALNRLHGADLFLACACARSLPAAAAAFERLCAPAMAMSLARFDLGAIQPDDIKQQLRTKLLVADADREPKIAQYSGRGELKAWVGVAAVREALQMLRRPRREVLTDNEDVVDVLLAQAGPGDQEIAQLRCTYRAEFKAAFEQAVVAMEPRERNLLRYRYLEDLNIDEIGVIYGIHRATAARQLIKARERLLALVRDLLMQRLRISEHTFDSIARLMDSNLELSLPRILGVERGPSHADRGIPAHS